ncbi:hypothetical protein D3C84_939290 [compost metagenome]
MKTAAAVTNPKPAGVLVKISFPLLNLPSIASEARPLKNTVSKFARSFTTSTKLSMKLSFAVASAASIRTKSSATRSFMSIFVFLEENARKNSISLLA